MRYDNATFVDYLFRLIDIAEEGGSAVFDDSTQENAVINKLKEIESIMQTKVLWTKYFTTHLKRLI